MSGEKAWHKYVLGGLSCQIAACCTNPIDVMKVRLQSQGELQANAGGVYGKDKAYRGMTQGIMTIVKEEGIMGLYKGLPAALLREGSYSAIRFGSYEPIRALVSGGRSDKEVAFWRKVIAGAAAGAIGSSIANPTDLVKIRMQADKDGSRYKGTLDAFVKIFREGGIAGLYKGVAPNASRAAIATAAQLPAYDQSKHIFLKKGWMQEGFKLHVVCSLITGFVVVGVSSPADVIKTRIMNSKQAYGGIADCLLKTIKSEGVMGLYKGAVPNWCRIGPHNLVSFVVLERLRALAGIKPM
eukprot:gnl/Hemi2/14525_TR4924_c0_g1_i1.p1 gnl/Hemi2/14525_TR4924_c0_g1~~gnl/Hemi2/14525_TR4924_c0_g1_i1.p1  ORF type:complete len:307 (-),score=91.08 gnl/Hemi2/14525_TR4924_c0_g1_i1:168-1058(-)